eukprot:1392681-Prymnesium_polylepis.1
MEAASEARYMHDMLRRMLQAPVFLDSSALNDLRELHAEVTRSDCLLLLATKGVLTRPWCLLELLQTAQKGIPVVLVQLKNSGFEYGEARKFVTNLTSEMMTVNAPGLDLLHNRLGDDLGPLQKACTDMLDINEQNKRQLIFDLFASDNALLAHMKDV